jgi:hypothetical protein
MNFAFHVLAGSACFLLGTFWCALAHILLGDTGYMYCCWKPIMMGMLAAAVTIYHFRDAIAGERWASATCFTAITLPFGINSLIFLFW